VKTRGLKTSSIHRRGKKKCKRDWGQRGKETELAQETEEKPNLVRENTSTSLSVQLRKTVISVQKKRGPKNMVGVCPGPLAPQHQALIFNQQPHGPRQKKRVHKTKRKKPARLCREKGSLASPLGGENIQKDQSIKSSAMQGGGISLDTQGREGGSHNSSKSSASIKGRAAPSYPMNRKILMKKKKVSRKSSQTLKIENETKKPKRPRGRKVLEEKAIRR